VNTLWGTGTSSSGYGQTSSLSPVTAGNTVTATQWTNLLNKISTIANHQGSSITPITNPSVGNTISAIAAISSNISTIQANKNNVSSYGASTDTSINFTSPWSSSVTQTARCTFAGGNEARYFFNSGGKIQVSFSLSGGTSDTKYNEWVDLLGTLCGVYEIKANTSGVLSGTGSPTVNLTTTGYYQLPDVDGTLMYQQYADTSPYTANYVSLYSWTGADDAVDGLGNNGYTIDLRAVFTDAAADTAFDNPIDTNLDILDGTLTTTFKIVPPSLTYISNTWGSPTWSTITNTGS
jgi:hypothetical protein